MLEAVREWPGRWGILEGFGQPSDELQSRAVDPVRREFPEGPVMDKGIKPTAQKVLLLSFIQSLIHSSNKFIEHLLCARHCSEC